MLMLPIVDLELFVRKHSSKKKKLKNNASFRSTASIADLVNANKGQPEILLYRLIAIEKISISIGTVLLFCFNLTFLNIGESVVLDRTSTEIKVTATLDANDGLLRE